jgi:ABC-type glycerol-3-phosphate transport system substrate-binding protein
MPTPTHAAITGGAFYTIPAKSPHKADACKYLEVINSEAAQREYLEKLVQIPGTNVEPSKDFLAANPWVTTMAEVAAKYPGGLGYAPPGYRVQAAEFRQIVVDQLAEIYAGQKSVKDGLAEAQKKLEAWSKKL